MSIGNRGWDDALPCGNGGKRPGGAPQFPDGSPEGRPGGLVPIYRLLADYEAAREDFNGSFLFEGHPALDGLHRAWDLACASGDRALAEHVLGKMAPYLSPDELDRLAGRPARLAAASSEDLGLPGAGPLSALASDGFPDAASARSDVNAASTSPFGGEGDAGAGSTSAEDDEPLGPGSRRMSDLVGFDDGIRRLMERGVLVGGGEARREFVRQMGERHGLEFAPARGTLLFRAPAREDADTLMLATAAELGLPAVRMRLDETPLGERVLCVMMANGGAAFGAMMPGAFPGPGVLVLEGIDTWGDAADDASVWEDPDASGTPLSRGARKALALIRSAVEDPQVTVFASASSGGSSGRDAATRLLGPFDVLDIANPDASERGRIWDALASAHSSLSPLDRGELARLTAGMPRCDIRAAAVEAVEEAYRESLRWHEFRRVTRGNVLDKIAAYQPVDSDEYREIEDILVAELLQDIERYDSGEDRGCVRWT